MSNYTLERFQEGFLFLVDKPLNWSSFQAVNAIKWSVKKKFNIKKIKIGHAGTLDPLASGLLLICCGKMTKQIADFQGQAKTYTGTIRIGASTPSYDLETPIDQYYEIKHITEELIFQTKKQFAGIINQRPPLFSALKKEGKRLYEHARAGNQIAIPERKIEIHQFDIESIQNKERYIDLNFKIKCSKGTYIRSIAHDFGKALDSGAHLSGLRRTAIGTYGVDKALSPEKIKNLIASNRT
ncbi:MAG: tRNA pseudouridine(55) synthase TruB [Flavobacteriaceae bacterium]|nr:tRNA pseudouridine(55) synthase TruB [Flavobacteriaceae bacterium]